ncbi:MAG: Holliday junction resolvase RuvX [Endomicrobium sp.]|nr:Holliday junction resolvase RuvX [Endomicrobium sp.]
MGRILAVDYGLKRIGLAMTDLLQITASPFETIESVSLKKNALRIAEIAKANEADEIVVGLPLSMNGDESEMTDIVKKFAEELKNVSGLRVETMDERLTTAQAERMLIEEADISRQKRKGVKDKVAAALILQAYLERKSVNYG